jgi:cysteinyl-tRNA synthetase
MTIQLYNTLPRKKEALLPIDTNNVRMYVCGPTVYDRPHIGNARSVVVYDVLYRLLMAEYDKEHVTFVRNITDVDDKINARAKERGITIRALTEEVTAQFHEDMGALNCLRPTIEPRATDHIKEMHGIIQQLIDNDHAYVSQGHVLFDVGSVTHYTASMGNEVKGFAYGMLSHRVQDELVAGARVEVESYKKNAGDFVLWKPAEKGDDPSSVFESPWGAGRPGWHIECSAMSSKHLGDTFDIHGGGADLMFPHHENEIAQSRCANKQAEFAKMWVHNGFLTVGGEKMSKSLGNFTTVKDLLDKGIKGEVIRYALLSTHYRSPLDWTDKLVADSQKAMDYFYGALKVAGFSNQEDQRFREFSINEFGDYGLTDDLNIPLLLSQMHNHANGCHKLAANDKSENQVWSSVEANQLLSSGKLLGFFNQTPEEWFRGDVGSDESTSIDSLVNQRIEAKKAKDWATADRIRKELAEQGIILEDRPDGTTDWRKA